LRAHPFHRFAARRSALLLTLMVAVWLAATLGLVHRTVHLPAAPQASAVERSSVALAGSDIAPVHKRHPAGWLAALFGEHGDAQCRLYDQLAHGAAAPGVPMMVLPLALPVATFHYLAGQALARWVALFDARGPPSSR
jgi:hypothetical protein